MRKPETAIAEFMPHHPSLTIVGCGLSKSILSAAVAGLEQGIGWLILRLYRIGDGRLLNLAEFGRQDGQLPL